MTTAELKSGIGKIRYADNSCEQRDRYDRRKVLAKALPAVEARVMPLFLPMERAANVALTTYDDKQLALLLEFLLQAREASTAAMAVLQAGAAKKRSAGAKTGKPRGA